tara:strand:- start:880 stop:1365 length:486 start_codon:yes stop_codon:yes gene_type:complete
MITYPKKIENVSVDYVKNENYVFNTEQTNGHKNPTSKKFSVHTTIQQTFLPLETFFNIKTLEDELMMDIEYASLIIQHSGSIIIPHKDEFFRLKNKTRNKVRANIFLTDWKFGQLVETEDITIKKWKKFNAYVWDNNLYHFAVNFSHSDKVTLQFSGYSNE